jgi:hypothetical protein
VKHWQALGHAHPDQTFDAIVPDTTLGEKLDDLRRYGDEVIAREQTRP